MERKILGKIEEAEFGTVKDRPFLIGLQMSFALGENGHIGDGFRYTVNISSACKWGDDNREKTVTEYVEKIDKILSDAKVNYVSELVGKPVEVTIENNWFKDFRILTEVL